MPPPQKKALSKNIINHDNYALNEAFFPCGVGIPPVESHDQLPCQRNWKCHHRHSSMFPEFSSQIPRCESSVMIFPKELTHGKQSTSWKINMDHNPWRFGSDHVPF